MNIKKYFDEKTNDILKVGLILIAAFFIFRYIKPITSALLYILNVFGPIFLGFVIAFIIDLPMNFFQEKLFGKILDPLRHRKIIVALSLLLSRLLFFTLLTLILLVVIPEIVKATEATIENIPKFLRSLYELSKRFPQLQKVVSDIEGRLNGLDMDNITQKITELITGEGSNFLNATTNIVSSVGSTLAAMLIGFVFSIYVSMNKKNLKFNANRILYANLKEDTADQINYVMKLTYVSFSKFLKTKVISCLILGVLNYIGMKLLNLPYAGMISILVGLMDMIPYVGPFIAGAVGVLLIFIESPFQSLVFLIFLLILQQVQGSIIYPVFIGKSAGLPAIWIFVSVFVGGGLFGIVGMIVFMPLATVLYTLIEDNTIRKLKKKQLDRITIAQKSQKTYEEMREEKINDEF